MTVNPNPSNSQNPPKTHKSLGERWRQTSLPNKINSVLAGIAILLSVINWASDLIQNNRQNALESTVATFDVGAQATSASLAQQQLNFQKSLQATSEYQYKQQADLQYTQVAMQSQMELWARQQALPLLKVIIPPEHIYIIERVVIDDRSSSVIGSGTLNLVIANNGGGQAGVVAIDWVKEGTPVSSGSQTADLSVLQVKFGEIEINLPGVIPAETPLKIQLTLEATFPYTGDGSKSDYQLGKDWRERLISMPNHIHINFSNTDPLDIQIADIKLDMPEVGFEPSPPSPFSITNKTITGVACFASTSASSNKNISIVNVSNNQTVDFDPSRLFGQCFTFPVGEYQVWWYPNDLVTEHEEFRFSVQENEEIALELPKYSQACFDVQATGDNQVSISVIQDGQGKVISDQVGQGLVCYDLPVGKYEVRWHLADSLEEKREEFEVQAYAIASTKLSEFQSHSSIIKWVWGIVFIFSFIVSVIFSWVFLRIKDSTKYIVQLESSVMGQLSQDSLNLGLDLMMQMAKVTPHKEGIFFTIRKKTLGKDFVITPKSTRSKRVGDPQQVRLGQPARFELAEGEFNITITEKDSSAKRVYRF